ncbi:MAG: hypothetical protein WAO55_09150 [Candidatus Manganitrophaceae bacterium]
MLQTLIKKNRRTLFLFTAALVVYLLLFSGFALFHAYSENELVDPHGCAIGLWVQQSQASLPFLAALTLFLIHLTGNPLLKLSLPVEQIPLRRAARAPPYHASFC